jgi:hypothetical protein
MADTTYNGWTNRETWLVGVHDIIDYDQVKEALADAVGYGASGYERLGYRHYDKYLEVRHSRSGEERALTLWLSDWLKDYHESFLYDILDFEKINPYIQDFTNFGAINWLEIAEHYDQEIKEALSNFGDAKES